MLRQSLSLTLVLALASCAHRPALAPPSAAQPPVAATPSCVPLPPLSAAPSEALVAHHDASLTPYQLEGGRWYAGAILLNEDFDFATAMSMNGIGAGLAAHKRMANNEAKREALQSVSLSPPLLERLSALRDGGTHVFFLLWGPAESASLTLIVDSVSDCHHSGITAGASVGRTRNIAGESGWAAPGILAADALELLQTATATHSSEAR